MAVARALRRLLRIRDLEEEQSRIALESAQGSLRRLEAALAVNVERDRRGRRLVETSAHTGELADRVAGLEEGRAAERIKQALEPRIADAEQDVVILREEFLIRRVDRRQVETLIEEAEARDALDVDRRSQHDLDDWFRNRRHRLAAEDAARSPASGLQDTRWAATAPGSASPGVETGTHRPQGEES